MPIVAAVDHSERAESVIRLARELADVYGVALHVVHVGQVGTSLPTAGTGISEANMEQLKAEASGQSAQEEATQVADEAARKVADHGDVKAVGLVGDAAPELIGYAQTHDAECIVVSARKRSSLGQALFGSVSQSLLLNADRPVVAAPHESK